MHEVVQRLKPHYKKLIELRYFKEYSYEEIVKELDLPLGTVKAQLLGHVSFYLTSLSIQKKRFRPSRVLSSWKSVCNQ